MTESIDKQDLILLKTNKFYNGSRYVFNQSAFTHSFKAFLTANNPYEKFTIYNKSFNEPITINEYIEDAKDYNYGVIYNHGDNNYTYIFIDSITTDAYQQSTISFTIDWWATNWDKINITKAHLRRYSGRKPSYMQQPYSPMNPSFSIKEGIGAEGGCVIFSFSQTLDSGTGVNKKGVVQYGVLDLNDVDELIMAETSDWGTKLNGETSVGTNINITTADINAIFIVPFFSVIDFVNAGWVTVYSDVGWYFTNGTGSSKLISKILSFSSNISTTDTRVDGVCDWNGNPVWECPYGVSISEFNVELNLSVSHAQIRFKLNNEYGNEIIGKGFTYECRQAPIVINQSLEYTWRERDSEIEMRKIQSAKQVWTNASDAIQGVGFGAAFGKGLGAGAAAIGGVINTASTYLMNETFDPLIQNATDLKYQRMQDLMSVLGDSITPLYNYFSDDGIIYDGYNEEYIYYYGNITTVSTRNTFMQRRYYYKNFSNGDYAVFWCPYVNNQGVQNKITDSILDSDTVYDVYFTVFRYLDGSWDEDITRNFGTCKLIKTSAYNSHTCFNAYYDKVGQPSKYDFALFMTDTSSCQLRIFIDDYDSRVIYESQYVSYLEGTSLAHATQLMSVYSLTMDSATQTRMNNDIAINGYYCDEFVSDLQSLIASNVIIQADNVVVEGRTNLETKRQVAKQLASGVEFTSSPG